MIIDCETCAVRGPGCADCVIPVLLDLAPPGRRPFVEVDGAEQDALDVLASVGLVPSLRHALSDAPRSSAG